MIRTSDLEALARRFRSASDPSRLRIIQAISDRRKICVSEVAREVGMSVAAVSHHLRALAEEGMVVPERNGKRVCYVPARDGFMPDLKKLIRKYI